LAYAAGDVSSLLELYFRLKEELEAMTDDSIIALSTSYKNEFLEGSLLNCDLWLNFNDQMEAIYTRVFEDYEPPSSPVTKAEQDGDFQTILKAIPSSLQEFVAAIDPTAGPIIEIVVDEVSIDRLT